MSRQRLTLLALFLAAPLAHGASVEVSVRDVAGQPVADAVVYAMPAAGAPEARPGRTVTVEQVDRDFIPYVSVVQAGTTVTFPNRDPILHHVYSFSPAKSFEIKLYTGKSPSEILLDKPGVITLGCNIHDWMIAYILVVATPHFARTDATGIARMRDVPAGSYELRTWHPQQRSGAAPQGIALDAAAAQRAAFVLDAQPRKAKFKPPLDRMRY
jgi:plastocyanin